MAPVCARFVQNAWKRDMCSNCFRSREEHAEAPARKPPAASVAPVRGIIRSAGADRPKRRTVSFSPEPALVIGHGGEGWSDDETCPSEDSSSAASSSEEDDDRQTHDGDRELERVTKSNTDHNTSLTAASAADKRRTFTQLMLGKPQTDAEGRKQTLLVSVTPFGQEELGKTASAKKVTRSHIPIAKSKDPIVEKKQNVVLTAYTKSTKETSGATERRDLQKSMEPTKPGPDVRVFPETVAEQGADETAARVSNAAVPERPAEVPNEQEEVAAPAETVTCEPVQDAVTQAIDAVNGELVKSRSELTIRLAPIPAAGLFEAARASPGESECESLSAAELPKESREQAGEPDGRADPEVTSEPPALPLTPPPPLNPRASFLHGCPKAALPSEKPRVPSKPEKVLQLFRRVAELPPLPLCVATEQSRAANKRRAPNPPPSPDPTEAAHGGTMVRSASLPEAVPSAAATTPEPAPRRSLSASQENLLADPGGRPEDKRKDKQPRGRFSLKRFLRVGGGGKHSETRRGKEEQTDCREGPPQARPRPVIVHPLELNGSGVEVVNGDEPRTAAPAPPPRNPLPPERTAEARSAPPPPRAQVPSAGVHDALARGRATPSGASNVYANLGEVRSGLTPCKPQRTASMREREALLEQRRRDQVEHLYERVTPRRRPEEVPAERHRFKSTSLPSYGVGEPADQECIYSPCSYHGGSEPEVDGAEWHGCTRPCRLRCRKGRSIVHRNLEDNYGAVVVANREALAQVLENMHQSAPAVQPALRGLQAAAVLRWSDFSVVDGAAGLSVGRRAFHHGLWGAHHVTLVLSRDQGCMHKTALGPFCLSPLTDFCDLLPARYLPHVAKQDDDSLVQATVAVLPWMQVETMRSFGAYVRVKSSQSLLEPQDIYREVSFVLLQLINVLKGLQAQGTEEVALSLNNFVLCKEIDRDVHHRLCLLQGLSEDLCTNDERLGSLCRCAIRALDELLPSYTLGPMIRELLERESAISLSQVKSVLEFSLWGPSDVALGVPLRDRELALQRWLDLERATVLHGLVGTRVQLSILEECHLLFLVRSSAKMMMEASSLLESNDEGY